MSCMSERANTNTKIFGFQVTKSKWKDRIKFTEMEKTVGRHGLLGVFRELVVKFWPY